ncbi:hypothetical protein M9H77_23573 [Catharanthus roseus]|uniref:Uncharacterized protein n=1 Tax=Catharanthus roseus TaxID=4058 RepID=A0ACC0AVF2_CATRO|nr:hypothetical protein M9H77_23573 [Catharanthus roseus]
MVRGNCHDQLISRITVEPKGRSRLSLPRIGIVDLLLRPLEKNVMEGQLFQEKWGRYPEKIQERIDKLLPYTRKIGLPESRVLYTVLRSPHIDKNSREQFKMEIKKQFLVIKTERHELRKKFFRVYLELNMKSYFLARPIRIRENSRDCFEVRSFALTLS